MKYVRKPKNMEARLIGYGDETLKFSINMIAAFSRRRDKTRFQPTMA